MQRDFPCCCELISRAVTPWAVPSRSNWEYKMYLDGQLAEVEEWRRTPMPLRREYRPSMHYFYCRLPMSTLLSCGAQQHLCAT